MIEFFVVSLFGSIALFIAGHSLEHHWDHQEFYDPASHFDIRWVRTGMIVKWVTAIWFAISIIGLCTLAI